MTVFRNVALLILLFAFAGPLRDARAAEWPEPAEAATQALAIRYPEYAGRCPYLCVEWFDGCNYCMCGRGRIDSCTRMYCVRPGRPRCLRYGF